MDLKFFNYSRSQKPTTDNHLGQVDESWYITYLQVQPALKSNHPYRTPQFSQSNYFK